MVLCSLNQSKLNSLCKTDIAFFDNWREDIQKKLEYQLPGYEVGITSFSKDETKAIVVTYSDKSRGTYYYYDVEKNKLSDLGKVSPWLNEEEQNFIIDKVIKVANGQIYSN